MNKYRVTVEVWANQPHHALDAVVPDRDEEHYQPDGDSVKVEEL